MKSIHESWTSDGGQSSSPARVYNSDGTLVATVEGNWQTSQPAQRAAIIAAAPEMLAALEAIDGIDSPESQGHAHRLVLKALAKARGET